MKENPWIWLAGLLLAGLATLLIPACNGDDEGDDAGDDTGEECALDEPCARLVECEFYDDVDFCKEAVVSDCLDAEGQQAIIDCFCDCIAAAGDCEAVTDCMSCIDECY